MQQTVFRKAHGAVTLMMTVVLIVLLTLVLFFSAKNSLLQEKMAANQDRTTQAFLAAQAGIEYGINYLKDNYSTVTGSPSGGYISYTNAGLTNVNLPNSSKYSIIYSNPVQNNYTLIEITSTGYSDDNSASYVVKQQVKRNSVLVSIPTAPFTAKGSLALSGSSNIMNTSSGTTIILGSTISIGGSAHTTLASGTSSTSSVINSDVQQNNATIAAQSVDSFTASYFGLPASSIKSMFVNYYSNSASTNYSTTLNGMTGTSIWIDQTSGTATLSGSTTIGSAAHPVVLVINGNLKLSGTVTIYGFVFIAGTTDTDVLGTVNIYGGMAAAGSVDMKGNANITYDPSVLSAISSESSMSYVTKVAGSWRDF